MRLRWWSLLLFTALATGLQYAGMRWQSVFLLFQSLSVVMLCFACRRFHERLRRLERSVLHVQIAPLDVSAGMRAPGAEERH